MILKKVLISLWVIFGLLFVAYSFTQIDLSLTFSQASVWQYFQKIFQYVGFYMRDTSLTIFLSLLLFGTLLYIWTLILAHKNKISSNFVLLISIILGGILFVSYNAFSYDFFNYIFDAKILTHYHLNPYQFKALDFPQEPMLSFMHSTHRVYPYGPSFLLLTVPFSFIGFNIFILTFYLFKALFVASYIGSVYFIQKIQKLAGLKDDAFATALFALSPVVLLEGVISAHNDLLMMFLALAGVYFLLSKKPIFAYILLILSIGIKFSTILLLPIFIYISYRHFKNKIVDYKKMLFFAFLLMLASTIVTSLAFGQNKNPEIQPWYLLNALAFLPFVRSRVLIIATVVVSTALLLSYAPFILMGQWPGDIVSIKNNITIVFIFIGLVLTLFIKPKFQK